MSSAAADHALAFDPLAGGERLFQLILEASPDLIYVYDRIEERYLFVSERSTTMLGYSPQQIKELRSEDIQSWIHPEDLAHAKAHYAKQEQLSDTEISMTTYRVRHAHGDYRLLRCRQKVFSRDHAGGAKCILGVATDTTDEARRQMELDALRAQIVRIRYEERQRLALQLPDGDPPLTGRERSVARLVAEGHSNKQIANTLRIGVKTVETHRASVMRKLDLASTAACAKRIGRIDFARHIAADVAGAIGIATAIYVTISRDTPIASDVAAPVDVGVHVAGVVPAKCCPPPRRASAGATEAARFRPKPAAQTSKVHIIRMMTSMPGSSCTMGTHRHGTAIGTYQWSLRGGFWM